MNTQPTPPAPPTPTTPTVLGATAVGAEPRARFADLLAAEWIKLWSLRSTPWAVGLSALIVIAINAAGAYADYDDWHSYPPPIQNGFVPHWSIRDAFSVGAANALMLAAGTIGALTVVSEYGTGQIRTTFAAVPARRSVMAARMAVVTVVMLGYGAVVALSSFGVTQAILSGRDIGVPIDHPGVDRVILASALLAPVCALVGMGLGALLRHTATTIATVSSVLLLLPSLASDREHWGAVLKHALPFGGWDRLVDLREPDAMVLYPSTVGGAWLVYAIWPLAAVLITMVVVHRRDL
ncbi:ABC transporter permease [Streptomyces sp. NPDC020965]|uniref:ABC transporter permease n=1 Tax=Streptomyces sp. NPDC020965 TaxID=3365105 RepID=UPI0037BC1367